MKISNTNLFFQVVRYSNRQEVSIINDFDTVLKFTDFFGINNTSFKRVIEGNEFRILNGKQKNEELSIIYLIIQITKMKTIYL